MQTTLTRIMGILRLILSLVWIGLCLVGMIYTQTIVQGTQVWLDKKLTPVVESLGAVHVVLLETSDVLQAAEGSLDTVEEATADVNNTLVDARPMIDEAAQVITEDVPGALEGMQASMPSLIETAATVDQTLNVLSAISIPVPNPLGQDWKIGLGVEYNPEIPLDQALEDLNQNLDGVPEDLRSLDDDLEITNANLLTLSEDLSKLSKDLTKINGQMEDLSPQVDTLAEDVKDIQDSLQSTQHRYMNFLPTARYYLFGLFALFLLNQIPSAYIGWILFQEGAFDRTRE